MAAVNVWERVSYFSKKYPTKDDFIEMLKGRCESYGDLIQKCGLLRLDVSSENFLGISLTMAPLRKGRFHVSDGGCALFVSVHTARPTNRLNLKHVAQLGEVYALARHAQNLPHQGFREFFERHFMSPPRSAGVDDEPLIGRLKLSSFGRGDGEEEGWSKVECYQQPIDSGLPEVEDLAMRVLKDLPFREIEAQLSSYLNEGRWNHFALLRSPNLFFILSVNRFGDYNFGFATGGSPKNYLKLKQLNLLQSVCSLITCFYALIKQNKHIYEAISEYQERVFK